MNEKLKSVQSNQSQKSQLRQMVEGLKNTDAGIIPNDWNAPCIRELTDILSGGTPSTKMPEYWGGEIRWMNSGELNLKRVYEVEGRISEIGLKNSATKLIPPKCVLVGLAGQGKTRGTVAINYVSLCTNQSIAAILPAKEFDEDFLYHNLDLRYKELRSLSTGDGGRGGLNLSLLRNLHVPLPPTKAEQTVIATALNDADALIQKLEQLIAKKRNIKTGAMQELLKPKEGWKVKKLGDFLNYEQPTKYIVSNTIYNDHNQTPVLTAGKSFILGFTNEDFSIFKNLPVIIFDDFTTASKYVDFEFKVKSSAMKILKPKPESNLRFVYELMQTIEFDSSDHKRYWISEYQHIEVKVPNPTEQTRIATILSDMDNEIQEFEKQLEKYKMMKQGMMQSLLTGKIRLV